MRVLVVEDDTKIADFVMKGLTQAGFAVDHRTNGEGGLHLALTEPLNRIRKTLGFRLTAWYSGLFTLSTLALFGAAYALLSASLQRRDREAIQLKLKEYAAEYQQGGIEATTRKLAFENSQAGKVLFFVRVAGPGNKTLFFTISKHWQDFHLEQLEKSDGSATSQWSYVSAKDDDDDVLEIASLRLPDHTLLQVGTSTERREDLLERFGNTFAGIMIPVVVIGLAGGAFLAFRALRPLRGLTTSLQSITEIALQTEGKGDLLCEAVVTCMEESERILAMVNTLMQKTSQKFGSACIGGTKVVRSVDWG